MFSDFWSTLEEKTTNPSFLFARDHHPLNDQFFLNATRLRITSSKNCIKALLLFSLKNLETVLGFRILNAASVNQKTTRTVSKWDSAPGTQSFIHLFTH